MKTKEVLFKFADGKKMVSVGDKVVVVNPNIRRRHQEPDVCEVTKIGSQYLYIKFCGREDKYNILTGEEDTKFTKSSVYSSLDEYNKSLNFSKKINELENVVRNSKLSKLTEEEIDQILRILNTSSERK